MKSKVFDGLDLRIDKGDRIAVVGVNGARKSPGKNTCWGNLFKMGNGMSESNTVIGYFAQHQAEELNPSNEVLGEVEEGLRKLS